jgi:hypothetical protein
VQLTSSECTQRYSWKPSRVRQLSGRLFVASGAAFSIFCQDVDFTKLVLDLLIRLVQSGSLFRSRAVITTVQLSSLGTMAILIDGGQSAKVDSFSRKIQIKSMLEILFLANNKSLSKTLRL